MKVSFAVFVFTIILFSSEAARTPSTILSDACRNNGDFLLSSISRFHRVASIPVVIPINVIFIGVDWMENPIVQEEVSHWLTQLQRSYPFSHVQVIDGKVERGRQENAVNGTYIDYEIDLEYFKAPWRVGEIFSAFISERADSSLDIGEEGTVDPHAVMTLLEDFVVFAGLRSAYTIIIFKRTDDFTDLYGYGTNFEHIPAYDDKIRKNAFNSKKYETSDAFKASFMKKAADWCKNVARLKEIDNYTHRKSKLSSICPRSCRVEAWVSNDRIIFIDTSAGPFSWGPSHESSGLKSATSIPHVDHREAAVVADGEEKEQADVKESEKLAGTIGDISRLVKDTAKLVDDNMMNRLKQKQKEYCARRGPFVMDSPDCVIVTQKIRDLQKERDSLAALRVDTTRDVIDSSDLWWLTKVTTMVRSAVHHIVAPASPEMNHQVKFFQNVVFRVFVVADHEEYDPLDPRLGLDIRKFKEELRRTKLPNQNYQFTVFKVDKEKSTLILSAYYSSLHTELLKEESHMNGPENEASMSGSRTYIDSRRFEHIALELVDFDLDDPSRLVIPIFIFSTASPEPILIDKKWQAKALKNMVLVAQNMATCTDSIIQCNGNTVAIESRNPVSPLLAQTVLFTSGLLPTHLSFNHELSLVEENWLWSVGANPHSLTTTSGSSASFNGFQIDSTARNILLNSVNSVISNINEAVGILSDIPCSRVNLLSSSGPGSRKEVIETLADLRSNYTLMLADLDKVVSTIGVESRREESTRIVMGLMGRSRGVRDSAGKIRELCAVGIRCETSSPVEKERYAHPWSAYLMAIVLVALIHYLRNLTGNGRFMRRRRYKLN